MSIDRNLALELVRATEAAALACARYIGGGDELLADGYTRHAVVGPSGKPRALPDFMRALVVKAT